MVGPDADLCSGSHSKEIREANERDKKRAVDRIYASAEKVLKTLRDTYKYRLWHRGQVVHHGITNNLERREREHQKRWPGARIEQVDRKTTRDAARQWERERGY